MSVNPLTTPQQLQNLIFDLQPTPILVLSPGHIVVLANKACQHLFSTSSELIGQCVSSLPITCRDGSIETLLELPARCSSKQRVLERSTSSNPSSASKFQVNVSGSPQTATFSACLLVTDFVIGECTHQMLSFEDVQEIQLPLSDTCDPQTGKLASAFSTPKLSQSDRAYAGIRLAVGTTQYHLEAKFQQLRDAIYFNGRERSGFLLSSDETFCYPNYKGFQDARPVEIDDLEAFFRNWDVWDPHFTHSLPLLEYPIVWLNRARIPYVQKRYGLKENGKRYVLEIDGDLLHDHRSGQYIGCVVWISNMGEYETVAEQDLKADLADFRTICDRLPHLLWTVDASGHADYFSQSWFDFTGFSEEQSLGLAFQKVIEESDLQRLWAAFETAAITKTEFLSEARYRRHDGRWIWMSVRAKPLFDAEGNILKWYGSSTNIDSIIVERLVAERQRIQIMGMLSLADVGLFEVDSDWHLTTLEGRMMWQDEIQSDNMLTKLDSTNDIGTLSFKKHLKEVMKGIQETAVFEELIGARWYKFRLVAGLESNQDVKSQRKVLGCSVDITEQRMRAALESENARLINEASFETEKSRLKTAFLAHMSHEIQTPIAGIIGTANMLAEACLDNELKDGINDIEVLGNNLLTIINDILDLSKIEAGKMDFECTTYDMNAVISQVTRVFGHMLRGKPTQIVCRQDLTTPLVMNGDPGRVKQILTNLVSNAVKFTPKGTIELDTQVTSDEIRVSVRDSGEGIDEQTMTTLFKPFVQGDASTARRYGGTGLGLTISRDLAEKMGGSLKLSSVFREGTSATLTLSKESMVADLSVDHHVVRPKQLEVTIRELYPAPIPSDLLVLVVEDNAINQKIALNLVRKLGYRAEAVWNGQEALDFVEHRETPSLILMDCQMPLLDGYSATQQLRKNPKYQKSQSVPIIALTASAVQGDREKCYAAGMDDYLCKPVTKTTLQAMLDKFSGGVG